MTFGQIPGVKAAVIIVGLLVAGGCGQNDPSPYAPPVSPRPPTKAELEDKAIAETFSNQWCKNLHLVSQGTANTIYRLLDIAKTKDCDLAGERLSETKALDLDSIEVGLRPYKITDLRPVAVFYKTTWLSLRKNELDQKQLFPLKLMTALKHVDLRSNNVTDIDSLSYLLPQVRELDLGFNSITSLNATNLERFQVLETLDLVNNQLTEFVPLPPTLHTLDLRGNPIVSIHSSKKRERGNLKTLHLSRSTPDKTLEELKTLFHDTEIVLQ